MRVGGILLVEIEHQVLGAVRRGGFDLVDMQNAVFDRPAGDRARTCGAAKLAQPDIEARLPVCQPFLRPQWHGETAAFRHGLRRNESLLQIAIAPGSHQPDVPGAKRVAQMEQHRDLPEASVASRLGTKMTMPLRAGPQEAGKCCII